jgi:hypothetical protein
MTAAFQESLIHSPISTPRDYEYRSEAGLIPSAEYSVFFDDFYLSPTSNAYPGTTAIIDAGATITAAALDATSYTGVAKVTSDGASEGAALYWPKGIQLGLGKKFFMEVRCKTDDADDTDVQFGLSIANATTNPEDLYTTAATDLIAFGVLDGDATVKMLADKNNAGTTASTGADDMSDAVWTTLAFEVGGKASTSTMWLKGYVNGSLSKTWATETSIPDDCTLAPFIAARTGGDASHNVYFDYVRWSLQR